MGATTIPAWHYARLSQLAYKPSGDLAGNVQLPPGWRFVGTEPGASANVQVAIFANDAQGVVVGAERGTVNLVPDHIPNNTVIAVGNTPLGGKPTEQILRDLGNPEHRLGKNFIGYDIVSTGHSEAALNAQDAVSGIRNPANPDNRPADANRYYSVGFNTPHSPFVANNDPNIISLRSGADPVSSGLLGPSGPAEVTFHYGRSDALDARYASASTRFGPTLNSEADIATLGQLVGEFAADLKIQHRFCNERGSCARLDRGQP